MDEIKNLYRELTDEMESIQLSVNALKENIEHLFQQKQEIESRIVEKSNLGISVFFGQEKLDEIEKSIQSATVQLSVQENKLNSTLSKLNYMVVELVNRAFETGSIDEIADDLQAIVPSIKIPTEEELRMVSCKRTYDLFMDGLGDKRAQALENTSYFSFDKVIEAFKKLFPTEEYLEDFITVFNNSGALQNGLFGLLEKTKAYQEQHLSYDWMNETVLMRSYLFNGVLKSTFEAYGNECKIFSNSNDDYGHNMAALMQFYFSVARDLKCSYVEKRKKVLESALNKAFDVQIHIGDKGLPQKYDEEKKEQAVLNSQEDVYQKAFNKNERKRLMSISSNTSLDRRLHELNRLESLVSRKDELLDLIDLVIERDAMKRISEENISSYVGSWTNDKKKYYLPPDPKDIEALSAIVASIPIDPKTGKIEEVEISAERLNEILSEFIEKVKEIESKPKIEPKYSLFSAKKVNDENMSVVEDYQRMVQEFSHNVSEYSSNKSRKMTDRIDHTDGYVKGLIGINRDGYDASKYQTVLIEMSGDKDIVANHESIQMVKETDLEERINKSKEDIISLLEKNGISKSIAFIDGKFNTEHLLEQVGGRIQELNEQEKNLLVNPPSTDKQASVNSSISKWEQIKKELEDLKSITVSEIADVIDVPEAKKK